MGSETGFNLRSGSSISGGSEKRSLIPTSSSRNVTSTRTRSNTKLPTLTISPFSTQMPLPSTISLKSNNNSAVYKRNDEQQNNKSENHSNAPHNKNTPLLPAIMQSSSLSSSSSISVAELATRFLEQNVRNCIKPRIFPMESTSFPSERVPTPFVFTSASRIHHHRQRVLGLEYMDNFLHRTAVFSENRSSEVVSASRVRIPRMNSATNGHSSPAKKSHSSRTDFSSALKKWSAPIPPALSRKLGRASDSPLGKVKVMLRVCDNAEEVSSGSGILGVDQRRKQVTLIDPGGTGPNGITPEERRVGVSAPKMFAFDGIFGEDDDQGEICAASAAELVASVVGGEDGCLVSLGYCSTGKKQTMFGKPANQKMGAVPTAISWLFKSIQEQKQKTGSRFSVRVSAVEVTGGSGHEVINDLLLPFVNDGDQPPGAYLLDSNNGFGLGSAKNVTAPVLNTVSEVRAPNPETAGFYLDAALDSINGKEDGTGGHTVFTLHIYQYSIDKNGKGVNGGRSRLHCVLLGNGSPSISVLSGLLLAVLNGQRHLPSSNHSKLGAILRECLGSLTCRAVVMIHVSNSHSRYAETLAALQLGSRVHRLRRSRRLKMGSVGSGTGSGGSSGGSGEEMRNGLIGTSNQVCEGETGSSDIDPSSSEQSCDTVIYLGPSIDEATDGEHPPVYLPSLETTSGENGCETKIVPSKCPLLNGNGHPPPKTKSPKPKSSNKMVSDGNFSSSGVNGGGGKSEEKWVDGPKVSKYRQLQNQMNSGGQSPKKKGETWIDGPAARVNHQANNFPSPKKSVNSHSHQLKAMRGAGLVANGSTAPANSTSGISADPCCISSTKAEMIQKWISNQTHSPTFFDDISHIDETLFAGPNGCSIIGCNTMQHAVHLQQATSGQMHQMIPSPSPCCFNHSNNNGYVYGCSNPNEPEYKALTVFKTCEEDEDEVKKEILPGSGYEFEFIEVVEPEIPVPTKDVCLQVTEEDIALSFLEEENPLPESDQNFAMASENYFTRARSTSFSEVPSYLSNLSLPTSEKNEDHPLRVLSQECLTVVSTFADSMSINDGDVERFWPPFSFNEINMKEIHEMNMCHGLCKNLATLSQMSLDNTHDFPMCQTNSNALSTSPVNVCQNDAKSNDNSIEKFATLSHKPPTGKILLKDPPILSPDSVFKIPPVPKPRVSSLTPQSKRSGGVKDASDAEQDAISIPPMELLDVTQIKNNCNPMDNQIQSLSSPHVQSKMNHSQQMHRGCDHNHYHHSPFNNVNGKAPANGNFSNVNAGGSGGSSHSVHSNQSTITPPSSPSPVIPILIAEAISKSPSKSKSRKISKFFRARSKSPKKVVATSSSESGKSSASSNDAKHSSSSSSCSSGLSFPSKSKSHSSPKHPSPSKKSSMKVNSCFNTSTTSSSDYHFTCDSALPMFLPSPASKIPNSLDNGNPKKDSEIKTT